MKVKFFIILIAASLIACLSTGGSFAAETSSLCDGCPLQEICSNTTEGVEVLSCSDNAAAVKTPAMDTATAMIAEEAGHAGDTTAVSAPNTVEVKLSVPQTTAETTLNAPAASAEASVFSSLTAYSTTGEAGIIVTLKGDKNILERFSSLITSQPALAENKSGCEILLATSAEITLKISKEAEKEKIEFFKSHGIKISGR